jgi:two-component system, NarL family, sensor kinase
MCEKPIPKQQKSKLKRLEAEIERLQDVEAELKRNLQFTESLLSAVPIPVFFKDAEGRYLGCNRAFTEIIGVTPDEMKGKKVYELWPSEHAEMYHQKDLEVMDNLEHQTYEFMVQDKNGADRSVIFSKDVFLDEKGKVNGLVGSFVDITARKQAEEKLRESEAFLNKVLNSSLSGIYIYDLKIGRNTYINPQYTELTGLTIQDIKVLDRKQFFKRFHPEDHLAVSEHMKAIASAPDGKVLEVEYRFRTADGRWISCLSRDSVFRRDADGSVRQIIGAFLDITRSKRIEKMLKELNENLEKRIKERTKELYCLYRISALGYKPHASLAENIQGVVNLIPPAWQYPDMTCSRIILEGKEFKTLKFKETSWKQSCEIILNHEQIGLVEVFYLKEMPERDEGPFVVEERLLIEAIAEHVSRNVERHRSEESIKSLSGELIRIQESERHRISRDLHDKVAQDLASLKIAIETLFRDIPAIVHSQTLKVSKILQILEESIRSVRKISYDLHPAGLDEMGIAVALEMLCNEYSEHHAIDIGFHSAGIEKLKIDSDTQINLYRIVQEGLNNILRHAEAKNVRLKLVAAYPNIILRMEDDGKGFEIERRMRETVLEKRMGLISMRERANLLGGKVRITSKEGKGTKVVVKFPFKKK